MMPLLSIPPLLSGTFALTLASFVFLKNPRSPLNRTFSLLCFQTFFWQACWFMTYFFHEPFQKDLIIRAAWITVVFIPFTYYEFVVRFLGLGEELRWVRWTYIFASVFLVLDWSSDLFIAGYQDFWWGYYTKAGPLHPLYLIVALWFLLRALLLLRRAARESGLSVTERNRRRLAFVSHFLYIFAACEYSINYGFPLYPIGAVVMPAAFCVSTYAMIRYQLMDIRIVITKTGLLLSTYLIVLGSPFLLGWWGRTVFEGWLGREWWLVPLGLCTALATAGPFAYAFLRRKAEGRLLKEQRHYQEILQRAAQGMTRVRDVTKLSNLITRIVASSVRLTHASLFLWDKTHQHYVLCASHGQNRLAVKSRYNLQPSHPLIQWLRSNRRILAEEEPANELGSAIREELQRLGATLIAPGLMEDHLVGFLVLGPKLSGAGYLPDDLHAFTTLAHEAALAIDNALSYEELLRVNEQLKAASERLLVQERLAAAGQFATGMAHEIKNPLSAIKTFAQYLPEKYDDPAFRKKFFRIVQAEIDRINEIVRELSDFAKPAPLQLQPVRVSQLVEDTLSLLSNQCLEQGVEIRKSFEENGVKIQADPQQLKQVLLNLLLNSLEAMPQGGRLEVATSVNSHGLTMRIADTGSGVNLDQQKHVWDPFFTTKERGMGLGLAIVKGVVERHGGRITLSSRPGQGTSVEVNLPI